MHCSTKCANNNPIIREKLRNAQLERVANGTHKGWMSRNIESYPEKFFKKVLENNNIEYEFNKTISKRSLGIDDDSNYFLDFYIKNKNIDLEIDGKQHKIEEREEHDIERDNYLINSGYKIYRIEWKNINTEKGKKYIKNEINKFLEYYNGFIVV